MIIEPIEPARGPVLNSTQRRLRSSKESLAFLKSYSLLTELNFPLRSVMDYSYANISKRAKKYPLIQLQSRGKKIAEGVPVPPLELLDVAELFRVPD